MLTEGLDYVPYEFWSPMNPQVKSILEASLSSYRHELLVENLKWIPIQQQHGDQDDNVPIYHSRLMNQRLLLSGWQSSYTELSNRGHFFDGIMTTKSLAAFYEEQLQSVRKDSGDVYPFCLVVATPGDTGSKGGVKVSQLKTPGQIGKICVSFNDQTKTYEFMTSNILSFVLLDRKYAHTIIIDHQRVPCVGSKWDSMGRQYLKSPVGPWQVSKSIFY